MKTCLDLFRQPHCVLLLRFFLLLSAYCGVDSPRGPGQSQWGVCPGLRFLTERLNGDSSGDFQRILQRESGSCHTGGQLPLLVPKLR